MSEEKKNTGESDWFDRPKSRKLLWILLIAACGLFLLLDFGSGRYKQFTIEKIPFFFPLLGFASCAACIFLAKTLGKFLKVREDYYEPEDESRPWDVEGGDQNE